MKIIITEEQLRLIVEGESNESILIVGDSHTVDVGWTWSSLMKKSFENVTIKAVGGKRTSWMKEQLANALSQQHYDKVFIWGGNNDTFSLVPNSQAIENIQQMVNMVNKQNGKAYVIQGFDYEIFADPERYKPTKYATKDQMKKFRKKYMDFQNDLATSITGAVIIPKFKVGNSSSPDNVHGNSSAHKIVFNSVVDYIDNNASPEVGKEENLSLGVLSNLNNYIDEQKIFKSHTGQIPYERGVEDIQTALQFLGFSLPVWGIDGKFGPETRKAVQDFQETLGVDTNGVVDSDLMSKLLTKLKDKNFEDFDLSKLNKEKKESLKLLNLGQKIVIENPGVGVNSYPSDLVERFREVAGEYYEEFISNCKSIGLDPLIAIRQLYTESGFQQNVINCSRRSTAGAMGLAQFMPGTWGAYGGGGDPCNVPDALRAYVRLMRDNLKRFPGRPDIAVASYNSGPNKSAYKSALNDDLDFTSLKGKIPMETYKYTSTIFQS